jgi:cardiolipin synthase
MHFVGGNDIKLLRNGTEYFPALEFAIENAKHEIYLQTYIYEADNTGKRIGNALKNAANRGVAVNLLLDGFGCKDLPETYTQELEQAGVVVMFYRPKISPWTFKKNRLRRLHRKVVVIDGCVGFVGGINIIDDENTPEQTPPRIDYAVQIEGTLIPAIENNVRKLWRRIAWSHLRLANADISMRRPIHMRSNTKTGLKAAFVIRDNVLHRRDIEVAYLSAISLASNEIIIANAYFVPGRAFRKALIDAAKRGVKVKLLLQGRIEYFMMFATRAFYWTFLNSGIEIYEYRKSFMHSKVAVIDSRWATIGSSNIDPFSLLLAHEANVLIDDKGFANELRVDIEMSISSGAQQVTAESWANANVFQRIASWIAYSIVRFFLGIIGNSKK